MLTFFFTDLASAITSFVTILVDLIVSLFKGLFLVETSNAISGISPIGQTAIAFIAIYMAYKYLPTVLGWLRLRVSSRRKKRARAK